MVQTHHLLRTSCFTLHRKCDRSGLRQKLNGGGFYNTTISGTDNNALTVKLILVNADGKVRYQQACDDAVAVVT